MQLRWNEPFHLCSHSQRCRHWIGTSWLWGNPCNTCWLLCLPPTVEKNRDIKVNYCIPSGQTLPPWWWKWASGRPDDFASQRCFVSAWQLSWLHINPGDCSGGKRSQSSQNKQCSRWRNLGFQLMCVCEVVHSNPSLTSHSWIFFERNVTHFTPCQNYKGYRVGRIRFDPDGKTKLLLALKL